jgi:hypothetical protein
VEGIRTKLDRIYLETLNSSNTLNSHGSDQESHDLQEELESLYSEILPVAQMSAEQQYLEPALKTIAASNGQGQERSLKAVKYVCSQALYMHVTNRMFYVDTRLSNISCPSNRNILGTNGRKPMSQNGITSCTRFCKEGTCTPRNLGS